MARLRKRTAAVPSDPGHFLNGYHIAFAGARLPPPLSKKWTLTEIRSQIESHGGSTCNAADSSSLCTHLVCNSTQYQQQSGKVPEAVDNSNVDIVGVEWLEEVLSSKSRVDVSQYLLYDRTAGKKRAETSQKTAAVSDAKKRGRIASGDVDDDSGLSKASKKVKVEPDADTASPTDGQAVKSKFMNVPLDEGLLAKDNITNSSYTVFISDDGTIYDATLNLTNSGYNNNKFYRIQLLQDKNAKFWCWTRWGRVGEKGQTKMLGNGNLDLATKEFCKKFKDKNGNTWDKRFEPSRSYSFIERNYEESDDEDENDNQEKRSANAGKRESNDPDVKSEEAPPESKLPSAVQRLIALIFNQEYFTSTFAALNYDANKMPLGKLSKRTLLRGYDVLKELAGLIGQGALQNADLSNQYFSLIPHDFGRNRPPVISSMDMVKQEIELLETLTDMQLANEVMKSAKNDKAEKVHLYDRQYQGLKLQEMTPLSRDTAEFQELESYLTRSAGATHHFGYNVQDIFRIERQGENERFANSKFGNYAGSDRRLLWHGSRCTNFGGILSQGLRIAPPEAPVSGYMFGKGVYLADMSSKSAGYCASHTSGSIGLLLLCEAELGKPPLKLTNADYNAGDRAVQQGSISTWGVGGTAPQGWKDASCVHENLKGVVMPDVVSTPPGPTNEQGAGLYYNEFICYDVAQIKLRYLLRCEIR